MLRLEWLLSSGKSAVRRVLPMPIDSPQVGRMLEAISVHETIHHHLATRASVVLAFLAAAALSLAAHAGPESMLANAGKLTLVPSSTSLAGGKVRLATTELRRAAGKYIGEYQLKVVPYFFKSETGSLMITASDEALRTLAAGTAVIFGGKAVTAGTGKTRNIKVKATPAGADATKGSITISIPTENGELVFESEYTFRGK